MGVRIAIVFGGAGFVGSHLLRTLEEGGDYQRLVCADIAEPQVRMSGVDYLNCDVRKPIDIGPVATGAPVDIFNLAAIHTTPGHEDWEYYWTNVLGAINVCAYASRVKAERVTFTSSISVYGSTEEPKDEDSLLEPNTAYGRSKCQAEMIHRLWQEEQPASRRLTIVRPGVIYGLGEGGNFTRLAGLLEKGRFIYPGRTDTIKACGYVKDLTGSMVYVNSLNHDVFKYNFALPVSHTSRDICHAFCDVAHFKEPKLVVPTWAMMLAAMGFEVLAKFGIKTDINRARIKKLVSSTNIVPKRLLEVGFRYQFNLETSLRDWLNQSRERQRGSFA